VRLDRLEENRVFYRLTIGSKTKHDDCEDALGATEGKHEVHHFERCYLKK
jgi:hypothetical protein